MRVRHLNEADVPTKYFFSLEKRLPSKQLSQLRLADSSITFTQSEIKLFVKEYFSKIYSMEQINPVSVASISVGLPVLCADGRSQLERPITLDELGTALHGLAIGKAPGLDGLTTEFYKKFWHLLGPELINTLNASCQLGELPQSCRRALLTLIPKKGDMLSIENWRPISLLCTDYKIFSKALASRLTPYLSSLLKEDQCYCVPKRSIYDNISLVRDIIELCKESPKDLGLLLLDQEKAFDRVDHRYLFEVLERFGLGSTFISYIKILYNNIYSVLKINNELVAPLSINKGIRQGCPLSGLLYALSIEPLLVSLRCRLTGVSLSQLERPIKVLAYADDVCVFVQDINDVNIVRYCLSLFEKASSAKVNWNKTSALWLGPLCYLAPRLPAPLSWANDGVKYLGVFLGNNTTVAKNWAGLLEFVEGKLQKWKGLITQLSYRGRVLVINTLVASTLWHRFFVLHPPAVLLQQLQKCFVSFFWDGKHWLRPGVLSLPLTDGGQGLVDIKSRLMAFRLSVALRMLYTRPSPPWVNVARHLLQQAGRLGYDHSLFLMDLSKIDTSPLSGFYQSMLNAWQALTITRATHSYTKQMFLEEPLFYNSFFHDMPADRCFIQRFTDKGVKSVADLLSPNGSWIGADALASLVGVRSSRIVARILCSVLWTTSNTFSLYLS